MTINYTGRRVDIKDSFKKLAETRLKKLTKFFGNDVEVNIEVVVEKKYQKVEITVLNKGFIFRTEKEMPEMEEALEIASENLIKQIIKNKSKLEKRGYKKIVDDLEFDIDSDLLDDENDFEIVKSKKFAVKPMNVEEAILQMNQLGHSFFIFLNADTGSVNVVYSRKDGKYALLEPEIL